MSQKRSAMFMQSDVDRVMEEVDRAAEAFDTPSDFYRLLASEVATRKLEAEEREARRGER